MGHLGSKQLPQALQAQRQLLFQLPGHTHRRQGHARLHQADELQGAVEPPPRLEGQPLQLPLGKRQLRHVELRAQQHEQPLQPADAHTVDTHIICELEHHVLKHRPVAQLHSQPQPEHARLYHRHDAPRP